MYSLAGELTTANGERKRSSLGSWGVYQGQAVAHLSVCLVFTSIDLLRQFGVVIESLSTDFPVCELSADWCLCSSQLR